MSPLTLTQDQIPEQAVDKIILLKKTGDHVEEAIFWPSLDAETNEVSIPKSEHRSRTAQPEDNGDFSISTLCGQAIEYSIGQLPQSYRSEIDAILELRNEMSNIDDAEQCNPEITIEEGRLKAWKKLMEVAELVRVGILEHEYTKKVFQ